MISLNENQASALYIIGSAGQNDTTAIINSTIVNNENFSGVVVQSQGQANNVVFFNTVVWGNSHNIIFHSDGSPYTTFENCMIWDRPSVYHPGNNATINWGSGNIDQYPS